MPPFLLSHGTAGTLLPFEQSEKVCGKVREMGGSCELYPIKGAGTVCAGGNRSTRRGYKRRMVAWLEKELADGPQSAHLHTPVSAR